MTMLNRGIQLQTGTSREAIEVLDFLGDGTQGEVYRAKVGFKEYALKWYFPHMIKSDLRLRITRLVEKGPPGPCFLWPLETATDVSGSGFGYIMTIRPAAMRSVALLMNRTIEPSFRALLEGCRQLVDAFVVLHTQGLCYRDISFENICIDPRTGDIRILDNDNVDIDGQPGEIAGTPRFMAPEIVVGTALPTSRTDLFSLSVLLFYMMMFHHPLEGAEEAKIHALDLPAMRRLYGERPIFIFDPANLANRPVPGLHENARTLWPLYPELLRTTFTKAFTRGIREPNERVPSSEWRFVLSSLMDALLYCRCGAENFYDPTAVGPNNSLKKPCWKCSATIPLPPHIKIRNHAVMLNHDSKLYPHHVDETRLYDFSAPVAEVAQHPANPNLWGLRNLCRDKWVSTPPNGSPVEVPSGRSVNLTSGTKIQFGTGEGEIHL